MKKTAIIVLSALCIAACTKQELSQQQSSDQGRTVTLTAATPVSKVNVGTDGKVTWSANDEIAVYNTEGAKFKFTVSAGAGISPHSPAAILQVRSALSQSIPMNLPALRPERLPSLPRCLSAPSPNP